MKTFFRCALGLAILFILPSCGGEVISSSGDPGVSSSSSSSASSMSSSSSGGNAGDWTTLIDGTWSLPSGTESYWCAAKTIKEDTYITAFRAQAPPGTHHTLLLRENGAQPDGQFACGATLGADMLFASGVGTDDLTFPAGVAVKVPAGTQLVLNLHLFNATAATLSGTSATLVKTVPVSAVKETAEMMLGGTTSISVPPFGSQTVKGTCVFPSTSTISTVWPHMHMYGTHMTVTHQGASGSKVLHDGPYGFGEQKNYPITPLTVAQGESIVIECTYQNPTADTIHWGDSSKSEMCFAGLYVYPMVSGLMCQ